MTSGRPVEVSLATFIAILVICGVVWAAAITAVAYALGWVTS
jgi:K+-transporting ATPase c subunit